MKQLSPRALDLIAQRFRALGEPARLKILTELMQGERTVTALVEATDLGQANLSKHLQLLRSEGFVERRKEGSFAHYRVADPSVYQLCEIMCATVEEQAEANVALLSTGTDG